MLDMTKFFPCVLQAVPTDDYKVYAYFNDGSIHCIDIKPLLQDGTVFEPLKDLHTFKTKITVMNDTVAWDLQGNRDPYNCIDLDPLVIFNTPRVPEPPEIFGKGE